MNKNFKLTVITVCRNEPNVERTCESIVSQTWQDFEWIVVDGASTDGTLDILEKYKDRIDVFVSEPDTGIFNAMNKGIRLAHGEFLNFMNGGDEFANPDVLMKIFGDKEKSYAGQDVLYGNAIFFYPNSTFALAEFPGTVDVDYCFGFLWKKRHYLNHQSTFIRRDLLKNGYDESLRITSDFKGWLSWLKKGKRFFNLHIVCAKFYMGGTGSANPSRTMMEVCAAIDSVFSPKELKRIYSKKRPVRRWTAFGFLEVFRESVNAERTQKKYSVFGIPVLNVQHHPDFRTPPAPTNAGLVKIVRNLQMRQNQLWTGTASRIGRARALSLPAASLHQEVFPKYRGINAGKELVIVGAGPTLDDYAPIPGAVHVGVNKTFLCEKLSLDYLFIQDYFEDIQDAADAYRPGLCKKFYGYHPDPRVRGVPAASAERANAERYFFEDIPVNDPSPFPFPPDIARAALGTFSSIIFPALQFALWTRPKRIYLVGCDCSSLGYCSGILDKTAAQTKFPLDVERLLYGWTKMKEFIEKLYPEVEIVSVNPVGLKGWFRDISQ